MKLFQQLLVAGASMSLITPIAAQASDIVNLEEMSGFSKSQNNSSRLDSKTFINEVSEDIANLNGRVDSLEVKQNEFEAGGFSDTTSLSGKAVFVIGAIDHPETDDEATDGISQEAVRAQYQYTMDLNTSFEDLQQGQFPEKLLEEMEIPKNASNLEIMKEIEAKHAEILEQRPLPELLETVKLIDNLKGVKKPVMGKLYDEKRQANLEKELQSKSEE